MSNKMQATKTTPQTIKELQVLFEAFGPQACREYLKMFFHGFLESEDFDGLSKIERSNAVSMYQYLYDIFVVQKTSIEVLESLGFFTQNQ